MKTVFVTGASRGIGKSIALELGKDYQVIVGFSNSKDKADEVCLLYTSPSPRDAESSRMPSSA